jgi:hypothetical protein
MSQPVIWMQQLLLVFQAGFAIQDFEPSAFGTILFV